MTLRLHVQGPFKGFRTVAVRTLGDFGFPGLWVLGLRVVGPRVSGFRACGAAALRALAAYTIYPERVTGDATRFLILPDVMV